MKILQIMIWLLILALFAGLYKPWWVLWWMARQNRKTVLLLYGTPLALFLIVYSIYSALKP